MARRTPKKKKKSNGVWIGSAISLSVLLVVGIALYASSQPKPSDNATEASSEELLKKKTLPKDLPTFGVKLEKSGSMDAVFREVKKAESFFMAGGPKREEKMEKSQAVIDALIAAAGADLKPGFMDKRLPDNQFESREFREALLALDQMFVMHCDYLNEEYKFDEARKLAASYIALGRQCFEKNVRLKARQRGLAMMQSGGMRMGMVAAGIRNDKESTYKQLALADQIKVDYLKILDPVKSIQEAWNAKLKTNEGTSKKLGYPNIGDLVKIAKEDGDKTFRVYGALRLGYALYERGDPSNQEAIKAAMDELAESDEAEVAKAAKAGRAIKREDYHELRTRK